MEIHADKKLEVALSGGGFRAAAFGLGVLLYLAHSGLNKSVSTIASVSGGSITNGYLASRCDFGHLASEEFWPIAAKLAQTLSGKGKYRGFFLWGWPSSIVLAITGLLLGWWLMTIVIVPLVGFRWGVQLPPVPRTEVAAFVATAMVWGVLGLNRDALVRKWMWWTFFRPKRLSLALEPASTIDHVFCTTDLTSSCPLFFSTNGGGRVFSERYGRGQGKHVPLHVAVAASAAFPPVISPASFELLHLQFTCLPKDLTTVWLTDGGVWNNLGTDWSHLRNAVLAAETAWIRQPQGVEHAVAESQVTADCPSSAVLLIANASKPDEWKNLFAFKVPVVSFVLMTFRVLSVSLNSTILGRTSDIERVAQLERGPGQTEAVLVQMTRKPDSDPQAGEMGLSALELEAIQALRPLWGRDDVVRTTFDNIGREKTLRMIVRGYLNTRRAMAGRFGHIAPTIPTRHWFERLLDSGASPAS